MRHGGGGGGIFWDVDNAPNRQNDALRSIFDPDISIFSFNLLCTFRFAASSQAPILNKRLKPSLEYIGAENTFLLELDQIIHSSDR